VNHAFPPSVPSLFYSLCLLSVAASLARGTLRVPLGGNVGDGATVAIVVVVVLLLLLVAVVVEAADGARRLDAVPRYLLLNRRQPSFPARTCTQSRERPRARFKWHANAKETLAFHGECVGKEGGQGKQSAKARILLHSTPLHSTRSPFRSSIFHPRRHRISFPSCIFHSLRSSTRLAVTFRQRRLNRGRCADLRMEDVFVASPKSCLIDRKLANSTAEDRFSTPLSSSSSHFNARASFLLGVVLASPLCMNVRPNAARTADASKKRSWLARWLARRLTLVVTGTLANR